MVPTDNIAAPPLATDENAEQHREEVRREEVRRAIEHRFRHISHAGHISPLLHLILRYKLEQRP